MPYQNLENKMKAIQLLLLLCGSLVMGQSIEEDIETISKTYAQIEANLKKHASKQINVDNQSTEGGEAIGYFDGKTLKKMDVSLLGETGKNFYSFYYSDDKLIFALFTRHQYNAPFYFDKKMAKEYGVDEFFDESKTEILENRYYFKKNTLLRWVNSKGEIENNTADEFEIEAQNIIELSNDLKKSF